MLCVYIVECSNGSFYVGATNNVNERIRKHNSGKGACYTKLRSPVKLVYQEIHQSKSEALKREQQIKCWSKSKKLALAQSDQETLVRLSKSRD